MDEFFDLLKDNITKGSVKSFEWLSNFEASSVSVDTSLESWAQGIVQEVIVFSKEMQSQDFVDMAGHYNLTRLDDMGSQSRITRMPYLLF